MRNKNPLISIIIPVYNVELYLKVCIESVLSQTYENIEIILVDDGSTDHSGGICDYYAKRDERVRVFHKRNGGLSDARNKGMLYVKGDYIMFIDSDDVVSSELVEYLYRLLIENIAEIAICDPVHCYPGREICFESEKIKKVFTSEAAIVEMLYQKSFLVAAWGKLYKRETLKGICFPEGILFEDSAIMYKIFDNATKIVYGNAKLYGYLHREGSITTKKFSKKDCDILGICEQIVEYFSNRNIKLQNAARAYQTSAILRIYMNVPRNDDFDKELEYCIHFLDKNHVKVLHDCEIRRKLKFALLMYKYARPIMPAVYKRINRWK